MENSVKDIWVSIMHTDPEDYQTKVSNMYHLAQLHHCMESTVGSKLTSKDLQEHADQV